ncbi:DEAD/DEAH box helicase [Bacillus sp. JJ722]|uniref:DEAD/DEAH box helicase n=1 Tax=Bacillus sp. JJ722 TaxID=3122973 RepID=UPI003000AB85
MYSYSVTCGAGKTEVLFEGIAVALAKGNRVCIATPRTDVVLELTPRLKRAFPNTTIAALFGGSEDKSVCAQLVISTTHQLLRYYKAFDTLIIDEVDAFPFSVDRTLQYAVQKSRKEQSSLIYLTATPSKDMKQAMKTNKLPFVTIPARFHRHSIPVPQLKWCGNWIKSFSKGKIPAPVLNWFLQKLQSKTPFLIFFPNIELMNQYVVFFQDHYKEIVAVYAEDVERKEKVSRLREGKILGLLTTTILERGITIPKLDVAVVGAEEDIFTESALVQIAGRVGRSATHPSGDVIFFHYGKTREMLKAVKQIQNMNKEARERGLIDD